MSELTGSNHRCRAQFKCVQTVVGQRFAGNGPNGLSYYYYYYFYYYYHVICCSKNYYTYGLNSLYRMLCTNRLQIYLSYKFTCHSSTFFPLKIEHVRFAVQLLTAGLQETGRGSGHTNCNIKFKAQLENYEGVHIVTSVHYSY